MTEVIYRWATSFGHDVQDRRTGRTVYAATVVVRQVSVTRSSTSRTPRASSRPAPLVFCA